MTLPPHSTCFFYNYTVEVSCLGNGLTYSGKVSPTSINTTHIVLAPLPTGSSHPLTETPLEDLRIFQVDNLPLHWTSLEGDLGQTHFLLAFLLSPIPKQLTEEKPISPISMLPEPSQAQDPNRHYQAFNTKQCRMCPFTSSSPTNMGWKSQPGQSGSKMGGGLTIRVIIS